MSTSGPGTSSPGTSNPGALWRICDRATFLELRRSGRRARSRLVTLTWIPRPAGEPPQVAYAIGRAVGSAVVRNRLRRRLRWALVQLGDHLPPGAYLIGVRPGAATATAAVLLAEVASAVANLSQQLESRPDHAEPR